MASFVVTGGGGFVGSNIAEALLERGDEVRIIDDFSTGRRSNIATFEDSIELHELDISTGTADLRRAFDGVDYVLHQAAIPSVPLSVKDPITTNRANVTGTLNVLLAARDAGVKRVVYASSSSVYGNSGIVPQREEMPTMPMSPYAVSKLAGENYCRAFTEVYGLETVALRYFNVFGPRQDPKSAYAAVIPIFISLMLDGKQPTIYGHGHMRDFTFVHNVVRGNLLACRAEGASGRAFNLGTGNSTTIAKLVEELNALLGTSLEPLYEDPREGDIKRSLADVSAARSVLGYEPAVSFSEGLKLTLDYYQSAIKD